jgi:hypothetical protein
MDGDPWKSGEENEEAIWDVIAWRLNSIQSDTFALRRSTESMLDAEGGRPEWMGGNFRSQ